MPLRTSKPPENALEVLSGALENFIAADPEFLKTSALGGGLSQEDIQLKEVHTTLPHQVFSLSLEDTLARNLENAKPVSWRYFLAHGNEIFASAEIEETVKKKKRALRFSHFNDGPFVEHSKTGIRFAEELKDVEESEFDLRLLRIPALNVVALWLHRDAQNLLISIEPNHKSLRPFQKYTPSKFFEELESAARNRLKFDDSPISLDSIAPDLPVLTPREIEVLDLFAKGISKKVTAESLQISPNTVNWHLKKIYSKLQVDKRMKAVKRAKDLGLF